MTSVETTGPFLRSERLLDSKDFRRVLRRGRRRAHKDVVIVTTRNSDNPKEYKGLERNLPGSSRLGLTVSRKVGNAVVRNRFKRRTRAWFRARRSEFPESIDLVVIAKKSAGKLSYSELDRRLSQLLDLPPTALPTDESVRRVER